MTPALIAWLDALRALWGPPGDYPVDPERAEFLRSDIVAEMEEDRQKRKSRE